MLVERTDLRVAVKGAVFEISEAKRWLLGGYNHGYVAGLPHPIATEMALGFRFTAERLYEVGFLNRLVEPEELMPTAMSMAEHLLTLPPASRVNTIYMMRHMIPQVTHPWSALPTRCTNMGTRTIAWNRGAPLPRSASPITEVGTIRPIGIECQHSNRATSSQTRHGARR